MEKEKLKQKLDFLEKKEEELRKEYLETLQKLKKIEKEEMKWITLPMKGVK